MGSPGTLWSFICLSVSFVVDFHFKNFICLCFCFVVCFVLFYFPSPEEDRPPRPNRKIAATWNMRTT